MRLPAKSKKALGVCVLGSSSMLLTPSEDEKHFRDDPLVACRHSNVLTTGRLTALPVALSAQRSAVSLLLTLHLQFTADNSSTIHISPWAWTVSSIDQRF